MENDIMNALVGVLTTIVLGIGNYVFAALAIYKISKVEKVENPWLAWIPIANSYLLIKLGKGKMYFMVLAIASFFAGGYLTILMGEGVGKVIGTLLTIAWSIYTLIMYNRLCSNYDVNILFFVAGVIAPLVSLIQALAGLYIPLVLVSFYGHWKLYRNAGKSPIGKPRIESKVILSKKKK
ncbi:hypothetical protein ACQPU1_03800 [Clostridium paraputrificum]|uniref:hypothetical protein n=1 Tax=Clostridium paraputrificum TaxID=29363 RepID=UPI003D34AE23